MPINFVYSLGCGRRVKYPFRVGDIIRVVSCGMTYTSYVGTFKYFTGSTKTPYYCDLKNLKNEIGKEFKIFGVVRHCNTHNVIIYAKDRLGNDTVIDARGVKLVRQYPLREGETIGIRLKVLPI